MTNSISITRRQRKRRLKSGDIVVQTRWVLNYREPRTGRRRQLFFERQRDAQIKRNEVVTAVETGMYSAERNKTLTIGDLAERWLANRAGDIKEGTLAGYKLAVKSFVGPLLIGTQRQRTTFTQTGQIPAGTRTIPLMGHIKIQDLTTSDIRSWHKIITNEVGWYSANRAKTFLAAVLAMAAEDLSIRPPTMPRNLGRGKPKFKKAILTSDQITFLLKSAEEDREKGIYVVFPFLAGTRPSEQLGLLWEDIDFEGNRIRICRMQERTGEITNLTKTVAGTREIPMSAKLRRMLLEWRVACPRRDGELHRVFPGLGHRQAWPLPRIGGGGPLLYWNFRTRIWVPMLKRLRLPAVTPHSARHCFISTLQAQGIEVGLVAKLAGHANVNVTLGFYTHAVRGGEAAMEALDRAYTA